MNTRALIGFIVVSAVAVGGGGVYWREKQKAEAIEREKAAEIARKQAELEKVMAEQKRFSDELQACHDLTMKNRDAGLRDPPCEEELKCRIQVPMGKPGTPGAPSREAGACTCQPGDPLCSCL